MGSAGMFRPGMTPRQFAYSFSRYWLTSVNHLVFVCLSVFLFGATRAWLLLPLTAAPGIAALVCVRLTRPNAAPATPRLGLKAPDPAPGQCPVCSLEDLDEVARDDVFAAEIDESCVRVVQYGPHRAHFACAKTVPYVAPDKPVRPPTPTQLAARERCVCKECTQARARRARMAQVPEACAEIPTRDGLGAFCLAHNQGDPACTVYPPRKPLIAVYGHCRFCGDQQPADDTRVAEQMVRAHALYCGSRPFVGMAVPAGFVLLGELADEVAPGALSLRVSPLTFPLPRPDRGAPVLLVNRDNLVVEAPRLDGVAGACSFAVVLATPVVGAHPAGLRVCVPRRLDAPEEMPAVVPGHLAFTVEGRHTFCGCEACERLRAGG